MRQIKNYFIFTKREKNGIFVLMLIIFIELIAWAYVKNVKSEYPDYYAGVISTADTLEKKVKALEEVKTPKKKSVLFYFDPNKLEKEGWLKLGLSEKQVSVLLNFRNKGGRFYKKEDLLKVYSIDKVIYNNLEPYVRIGSSFAEKKYEQKSRWHVSENKASPKRLVIELNTCDTTQLKKLKGIGRVYASRIIKFRKKLGGFYSTDQLQEVYGLKPETYSGIKEYLVVDSSKVTKININTSDLNELKAHPYISYNLARAIVNYRNQHGRYSKLIQLKDIDLVNTAIYGKIAPYLKIQ